MTVSAFVAYPCKPQEIGQAIMSVAEKLRGPNGRLTLNPWEQNDIAPAVANAIWFATGKRIRSTPFRKHDLSRD